MYGADKITQPTDNAATAQWPETSLIPSPPAKDPRLYHLFPFPPQLAVGSQKTVFTYGHIIHSEISPSPA